ncbi:MAG: AAA family ATPase [Deltaproteobacteria bacterium]|nr:AAA family ATPase [Deltaproteobacteria bacterium]
MSSRWKDGTPDATTPLDALDGALGSGSAGFVDLFRWFRDREDLENAEKVRRASLAWVDPQLHAVRSAVTALLPGFSGLRVDRSALRMAVDKDGATLFLDQLSDGERNLLALTADVARRLAMANPELTDPLTGEAVVLVDEIELHLHPSWQRRVLGDLTRTFPRCQFIVTTHSPQVLSEVPNDAVIVVKDFQCYRPAAPTEGRTSRTMQRWTIFRSRSFFSRGHSCARANCRASATATTLTMGAVSRAARKVEWSHRPVASARDR